MECTIELKRNNVRKLVNALQCENLKTVERLTESGSVSPNEWIEDGGVTALHLAIGYGTEAFAACATHHLLRHGADPNVQSADGMTPVHVAAAWGRVTVLHLLLLHGGDPWIQDQERMNAFNHAFEAKAWNVIEMLHNFQLVRLAARPKCCLLSASPVETSNYLPSSENSCDDLIFEKNVRIERNEENSNCNSEDVHNLTFCIEPQYGSDTVYSDISEYISPVTFVTTRQSLPSKKKTIILEPSEVTSGKTEMNCTFEFFTTNVLTVPQIPSQAADQHHDSDHDIARTSGSLSNNVNRTYTVEKPMLLRDTEKKEDSRASLFAELSAAVEKRKLRLSGIETLESGSDNASHLAIQIAKGDGQGPNAVTFFEKAKENLANVTGFTVGPGGDNASRLEIQLGKDEGQGLNAVASFGEAKETWSKVAGFAVGPVGDGGRICKPSGEQIHAKAVANHSQEGACERRGEPVLLLESDGDEIQVIDVSDGSSFISLPHCAQDSQASFHSCESEAEADEADGLRKELRALGVNPGPITTTTKAVYLRLLTRLQRQGPLVLPPKPGRPREGTQQVPVAMERSPGVLCFPSSYCPELNAAMDEPTALASYARLEAQLRSDFDAPSSTWRGGSNKTSFNYLLLDGRVSRNLPHRAASIADPADVTRQFLASVFYIGKGQAGRPFAHLHEAVQAWHKGAEGKNPKESVILDIWRAQAGVVCVHVFHNTIPAEALTREAAMIEALGRQNLRNLRRGEFYGAVATWSPQQQRMLGVHLLLKAKNMMLQDGERAIHPGDL